MGLSILAIVLSSTMSAKAVDVGYVVLGNPANVNPSPPIIAAGHTPVPLGTLAGANLGLIDVLWILNPSNGGYDSDLLNNLGAVHAFVNGGGVLSFHDRYVDGAENILPGIGAADIIRSFSDDANIEIVNNTTLVTNGPGGVITNTTLDGGTSSSHGFTIAGTAPAGSTLILSRTSPDEIVDFTYPVGAGHVYYSTIPMDYYLDGNGPALVGNNFRNIYAPNEVAFQASLVPEPGSLVLLTCAIVGLGARRKRSRVR
jgi:hypothetical protein